MNKIPMLERFAAQSLVEYDGELIFSKEKFAELIVRECIQAVKNVGGYNEDYHMNAIKKYFGVE